MTTRWKWIACVVIMLAVHRTTAAAETKRQLAQGPFEPSWESLQKNYRCPDWFRDAKFGIWAHWSAQCVPEMGDWYARQMYLQGDKTYQYHIEHYGHPSKFGFMEFDNLWKAEKWEPEKLIQLYKNAGAKFFVALANHHDNFDCYDSKYHDWNSVRIGPKKDIVGIWAKAARDAGLRFGVSNHSAHAHHWFQVAYGYDPEGPLAGVRYDAFTLKKEDGKGKWWEGLDPQDLYTAPTMVMPDGIKTIKEADAWHEKHDREWIEDAPANPKFVENWFLRCQDLVDKYHPDLLYFDDYQLPFGQTGLDIAAHYYNANLAKNGSLQAVLTAKNMLPERRAALVEDYERGAPQELQPLPWQTCTCLGEWHYHKGIQYKSVAQVTRQLVDIVAKNGTLLLSIPMRGDGTIDQDELAFLDGFGKWMKTNGQGIYNTRPWKTFGEGPSKAAGGMFNERKATYGPDDIRFTASKDGKTLYAFVMAKPTGDIMVKSLAGEKIAGVKLIGSDEAIQWNQSDAGVKIQKPSNFPDEDVIAFEITFK